MKKKLRQNKGITLVALVVTIIVLIILAGITIKLIFGDSNLIKKAKEAKPMLDVATAKEELELLKAPVQIDNNRVDLDGYLVELDKVKTEYKASNIERLNDTNAEVLINSKYKFLLKDTELGDVEIIYQGEAGGLKISPTRGEYTYPVSGTFEVIENESGGELSVSSSNENIAKASIEGTTVTVDPGTVAGEATITVRSAANGKFAAGKATHTAIVGSGTLDVTALPYSGIYDGSAHGITVTCAQSGAKITYATSQEGPYTETNPTYTNVDTYTTYYKVELAGYITESGSLTVTINKAQGDLALSESVKTYTYPTSGTFTVTKNVSNGTLSVTSSNENVATATISGNTVTVKPGTTEGKAIITVKSSATGNYEEKTITHTATVKNGTLSVTATPYTGTYDGSAHGITVTCAQAGAKITYATSATGTYSETKPTYTNASEYTTYYKVELAGYITESGSLTVTINKAQGNLSLSKTTGEYTYPTSGTFTVTKNVSNGTLSVSSSNTAVATATISGNTVTVKPGTTAGTATITVKSAATGNYEEKTITHTATVKNGTLDVTALPYSGTYDGSAHGITVTCAQSGAKITYATSATGTYSETKPTYTNASEYTTYYKVELAGYITESGSLTVTINKAKGDLAISEATKTYTYPTSGTFTVTKNVSNGTLSVSSSNTAVATATISGNTVTVKPGTTAGTATITVKSAATGNYEEKTITHTATVKNGTLSVTATPYSGTYDGSAHGITVTCAQSGAKITYATSASGTYSTTKPTYTNASTYTTYYKVQLAGYETVSGSLTVTISKKAGSGSVTMASWVAGNTATNPVPSSSTNGTSSVTYHYKVSTAADSTYTTTKPSAAGTYTVRATFAATTNYNACTATANFTIYTAIAQIGTTNYANIISAVNAGVDYTNTTVKMLVSTTESLTIPAQKRIVLQLNSKTITGFITNNGGLAVSGAGTIQSSGSTIINNGTLLIENATIYGSTYHGIENNGTATVASGTVYSNGAAGIELNKGTLNITGGTVKFAGSSTLTKNGIIVYSGTLNMSGGTVSSTATGAGAICQSGAGGTVNISGGTVSGVGPAITNDSNTTGVVTITGTATNITSSNAAAISINSTTANTVVIGKPTGTSKTSPCITTNSTSQPAINCVSKFTINCGVLRTKSGTVYTGTKSNSKSGYTWTKEDTRSSGGYLIRYWKKN